MVEAERATFEQVKQAQQDLIFKYMSKLEEKNSFIDSEDREGFWDAFDIATLGEASKHRFMLSIPTINQADMGSVSEFTKKMIFFTPTDDGIVKLALRGYPCLIPMRLLWKSLREQLVRPMDAALAKAHSASAELLTHPRDGFEVTDEKQSKNGQA